MKRSMRRIDLGWLALLAVVVVVSTTTTAATTDSSGATRTTPLCSRTSRRKLASQKGKRYLKKDPFHALDLFQGDFCEEFSGAAGCVTANGDQVIPPAEGDDDISAQMQFRFDENTTLMEYAFAVDGNKDRDYGNKDRDFKWDFVLDVGLYCGFAGTTPAGKGALLADLYFRTDGMSITSFLTQADLVTNDDGTLVDCEGRLVVDLLDLFDLMVDGTVFLEVKLKYSLSNDTYVRGQIYL